MVRFATNPGGSSRWRGCPTDPPAPTGSTRGKGVTITGGANAANVPTTDNASDRLWHRITSDGTTVTVKALIDNSGPPSEAAWSAAGVAYTGNNFPLTGGQVGFRATYGTALIRHFTLETDHDNNGQWTTEYENDISLANTHETQTFAHDAAGNLTYDGTFAYTYDAWNRLTTVSNAYRTANGSSAVQQGSTVQVIRYDGQGRRIQKRIQNSADRDATEHHYYDGQRLVELRNGSDLVLKQQIWGLDYIDELVEVAINRDPADATEQVCDRPFYAVHNAQYNVMGLLQPVYSSVTAQQAGGQRLVERYEYTPYGERRVYGHYDGGLNGDFNGDGQVGQEDLDVVLLNFGSTSPYLDVDGNGIVSQGEFDAVLLNFGDSIVQNDPLALAPRAGTYRSVHSQGGGLGVALNEVGHQGLVHDEEARLVYNRARYLHPGLGRFMQRDPLGYVDGMSQYAYYAGMWGGVDPTGLIGHETIERMQESRRSNGKFEGEKRFSSHTYTADNGNTVQVFYIHTAVWNHGSITSTVRGQTRTTAVSQPAGFVTTGIFAFSYCPGRDEERENDIEVFGESLEQGVKQDNAMRGQQTIVQGLTIALHSVPGGASADFVSQGQYRAAITSGVIDAAIATASGGATLIVRGAAKGSAATGRFAYRALTPDDLARLQRGEDLVPRAPGRGSISDQVAGENTRFISGSETLKGTSKFNSGNGVAKVDIDKAIDQGAGFVDHRNVMQHVNRNGTPLDARNARDAREVLFKDKIPAGSVEAIVRE